MSIQQELDARAEELNQKLLGILGLYLLGQLSSQLAKALADEYLKEAYLDLVEYIRLRHGSPIGYNAENERIQSVLAKIRRDFYDIIDKRGERISDEQLKHRVFLIALGLAYSLYNASIVEIAIILRVPHIRWNNTIAPPWPCAECEALAGTYSIYELIPERPHPECRCYLSLVQRR